MASLDEIEARVAELNEQFADLQQRAAEAGDKVIGEQFAGGVGVVQVGIGGQLVDVKFDLEALRLLDERRLGAQIVVAVHAAEAKAAQIRELLLGPISGYPAFDKEA